MHIHHEKLTKKAVRLTVERKPLTADQIHALLAAADLEWRGMILTGLGTGARQFDAAKLRWHQLNMVAREIQFRVAKSSRLLVVPMSTDLQSYFTSLVKPPNPQEPVFPSCFKDAQQSPRRLATRFRWLQHKAGLSPVGFFTLRLTFVYSLMSLGATHELMAKMMGHSTGQFEHVPARVAMAEVMARMPRWLQ